ncbi:heparan-alpha-glucosaminide N-acetyltransferase domain-containing protein [Candidatus Margulisiibacteriota bacterium]
MKSRDIVVDIMRTVALFMMVATHVVRGLERLGVYLVRGHVTALTFMMHYEAFIAGLFLFLVGYSYHLSTRKRYWQKAVILIGISIIIFLLNYGWHFPHLFLGTGILQTIGFSLLLLMFLHTKVWLHGVFLIICLLGSLLNDFILIPGLTVGSFPLIPYFAFVVLGSLFYMYKDEVVVKWGAVGFIVISILYSPLRMFEAGALVRPLTHGVVQYNRSVNSILPLFVTAIIVLVFYGLSVIRKHAVQIGANTHSRLISAFRWLVFPGRCCLELYVLHLGLIGIFVRVAQGVSGMREGIVMWGVQNGEGLLWLMVYLMVVVMLYVYSVVRYVCVGTLER